MEDLVAFSEKDRVAGGSGFGFEGMLLQLCSELLGLKEEMEELLVDMESSRTRSKESSSSALLNCASSLVWFRWTCLVLRKDPARRLPYVRRDLVLRPVAADQAVSVLLLASHS